jgi:hypothetical protein
VVIKEHSRKGEGLPLIVRGPHRVDGPDPAPPPIPGPIMNGTINSTAFDVYIKNRKLKKYGCSNVFSCKIK